MTDRALRRLPRNERPHRLDFTGAGLMVAAALALLLALTWGGKHYAWASPQIIGLIVGSAVMWGLFALAAGACAGAVHPAHHGEGAGGGGIVVAGFFGIGTIIGLSIFMPLYIELVLGQSAERVRPRLDRVHGRRNGRIDAGRPADFAARSLQAGADHSDL